MRRERRGASPSTRRSSSMRGAPLRWLQFGEDAGRGVDLLADGDARARRRRQVHVDARTEADETEALAACQGVAGLHVAQDPDRKSTRLNSSHVKISYAVFCLKKKKQDK